MTMQTNLRGRDLISLREWTREEIETVLDVATDLKRRRALGLPHPYLRDKVLAMLFFYSSTRTRASFEAGMAPLGGHPPAPGPARPAAHPREAGRPARPDAHRLVGLRRELPEAHQRAPGPRPAGHALRDARPAGPSPRVPAHGPRPGP